MRVGILAVQGAVSEHADALRGTAAEEGLAVDVVEVRTPADLASVHGIILPGGESTTISRLLRSGELQEPLLRRAGNDLAVLGTCAGLILLCSEAAHDVEDKDIRLLRLLEAEVDRNAFGRQRESFEATVDMEGIGKMPAIFIRAPALTKTWGATEVLATWRDRIVAARKGRVLGTAFHPELSGDLRLHREFLRLVAEAAEAAEAAATG